MYKKNLFLVLIFSITPLLANHEGRAHNTVVRANKNARQHPNLDFFENGAMVYDWEPNMLYQVYTAPNRITNIELEAGEILNSVGAGDTTRWIVGNTSSGAGHNKQISVYIKPKRPNLHTNLIVSTNRRVYHFELHSFKDTYMANVSLNYPKALIAISKKIEEKRPEPGPLPKLETKKLNFNYAFIANQKPKWMPTVVFDDGNKTYIKFPASMSTRDAPVLFLLDESGQQRNINYRTFENFFIIDRMIEMAKLKLGAKNPEIVGIERLPKV